MNKNSLEATDFLKNFLVVRKRLEAYVSALVPDHANAEEVFQQTSLALWERREKFDSERDYLSWAFGMAKVEAKRFYRRRGHPWASLSDEAAAMLAHSVERSGLELDERLNALRTCLSRLSRKDRWLLEEVYAGNKKGRDLAQRWGITPAALYQRLKRVREMLHECIDRVLIASHSA
ncbi:sigma-70 family RNA polymerase sigma factor [Planctomicrobium sp. SH664]|uniref:sigma-70 family RNA polymerase sigma factor n=1 Tax=Planctomicrobium sp. SH664 TaxID=3448125 RepID=UPI003F5B5602